MDTPDVSPTTCTLLSLGGAAVGVATIWMGSKMHWRRHAVMELGAAFALVGPSSGQWYARGGALHAGAQHAPRRRRDHGARLRRGLLDRACQGGTCEVPIRDHNSDALIGLGAAVAVGGMVFDIATAGSEARKMNRRRLAFEPAVMSTSRGTTTGLGLSGAF